MRAMVLALFLSFLAFQEAASGPRFVTESLDGRRGTLPQSSLPLADPREKGVWILYPQDFPRPQEGEERRGATARVSLVNGDELNATVTGGSGERLDLELAEGVVVPFELARIRSLVFPDRIPPDQAQALGAPEEGDRLYRRTAALDALDGTLEGFSSEGVQFDGVLGRRTFPWSEVGALFVESLGGSAPQSTARGVPVLLGFAGANGGRVRAHLLELGRTECRVLVGGTVEIALPWHAVGEVVVADGRLTFVSELVPTGETGRGAPFGDELGMTWPHRMDRSVVGGELRAGGDAWRHGIGMHAPATLSFDLGADPRGLRGRVAIDDSALANAAAARGSVVFRVRADDALLWESPVVRGGDPPLALPALDLAGRRTLVLEVDPAGDFAGDRANWLDLVLVR